MTQNRYVACQWRGCDNEIAGQHGGWWEHWLCREHADEERPRHLVVCPECGTERYRRQRNPWWIDAPQQIVCSETCRLARDARRHREARAAKPLPRAVCAHCEIEFVPSRKDARFCSGRCRVAAHRLR